MGDTFQSVTIKDGEEVTSNINPAGDSLPGKVVPLEKPYEATTDRIQISNSGEGDFYDSTRNMKVQGTMPSAGEGALSTVRTPWDMPVSDPSDITPKCSIEIEGKRMTIATAMQMGWLKKVNGEYQVAGSPSQDHAKAQEKSAQDNQNVRTIDFTDETGKANIKALNNAGSPQMTASIAHQLISGMVDGTDCSGLIVNYSQQIGADPDSVGKAFESMFNAQLDNALKYVNERYGINADEFADFVMNKASASVKKQVLISGFHNDLKGLEYVVKAFKGGHSL